MFFRPPQDNRYFFNRELLYFLQQLRLDILIDTIVVFIKIVSFVSCEKYVLYVLLILEALDLCVRKLPLIIDNEHLTVSHFSTLIQ